MISKACLAAVAVAFTVPTYSAIAASVSGSNATDVAIPDKGGFVLSVIEIGNAPADALVKGVDVSFKAVHSASGNLNIDFNADAESDLGNYNLWEREGGSDDNPTKTVEGIDIFDGLPVNRTWYLYVRDEEAGDKGSLDEWSITVHYESKSAKPTGKKTAKPADKKGEKKGARAEAKAAAKKAAAKAAEAKAGEKKAAETKAGEKKAAETKAAETKAAEKKAAETKAAAKKPEKKADKKPAKPKINAVSPSPVIGADKAQALTIKGSNFVCDPKVTLRDLARDFTFDNRPMSSCKADAITINPNFKTGAATWTVEVINPDGQSSGKYEFEVKASKGSAKAADKKEEKKAAKPKIDSVSPNPVPGADKPQPLTIKGSNFVCEPSVTLRDLARGYTFPKRSIDSCTSSKITINPNFRTDTAIWTVEVINPDGQSSGRHEFKVKAPAGR